MVTSSQQAVTTRSEQELALEIAYLTGRTCQFIKDVAENAGISPDLLTLRILHQLGDGEVRPPSRSEEDLPTLRTQSTKKRTSTRKVAVDRRTRRKLSGPKKIAIQRAIKGGMSVNAAAKKYKVSWMQARSIGKAA